MVDSKCGLLCTECKYKKTCGCGGCIETNGHPFYGKCPIAACCSDKGIVHCGECAGISCELLYAVFMKNIQYTKNRMVKR